jgi:hypothetical protein
MKYRDLKDERDAAVARAVEAERLSMKSEFDRVAAEFEREKEQLLSLTTENARAEYRNGFNAGLDAMADDIADRLQHRTGLVPPSLKLRKKENEDAPENPTTT